MSNLPFESGRPLADVLKYKLLIDALRWLADPNAPETLLAIKLGSPWAVGYSLICFFESRDLLLPSNEFPSLFEEKAHTAVRFLVSNASLGINSCHWDGVTWDTAVITRAILIYAKTFNRASTHLEIEEMCTKALRWLGIQILNWDKVRYTFGITDLAQTLQTLVTAEELAPRLFKRAFEEFDKALYNQDIVGFLANEIIRRAEIRSVGEARTQESIAVWDDDIFATAEALVGLTQYFRANHRYLNAKESEGILEVIKKGLRHLELEQVDGRWGVEESTALALIAYIRGYSVWSGDFSPEPHIVFKALRWLCDEKQRFSDGSLLHEMEPTIYFTLALLEVLRHWDLPDELLSSKPVIDLYDYVIWNVPARTSFERARRMQLESDVKLQIQKTESLDLQLEKTQRRLNVLSIAMLFAAWTIGWALFAIISNSIPGTTISIQVISALGRGATDWRVLVTIIAAWISPWAAWAITALVRKIH